MVLVSASTSILRAHVEFDVGGSSGIRCVGGGIGGGGGLTGSKGFENIHYYIIQERLDGGMLSSWIFLPYKEWCESEVKELMNKYDQVLTEIKMHSRIRNTRKLSESNQNLNQSNQNLTNADISKIEEMIRKTDSQRQSFSNKYNVTKKFVNELLDIIHELQTISDSKNKEVERLKQIHKYVDYLQCIIMYCISFYDGIIEFLSVLFIISMTSLNLLLVETFYFRDSQLFNLERAAGYGEQQRGGRAQKQQAQPTTAIAGVRMFDSKESERNKKLNHGAFDTFLNVIIGVLIIMF